ncbi:putative ankyrin repeat-containing domain, PGG domain, ankyrin repeat-containing domain superfamily [Helianthus annuus]|nr:putative ankyrin repeat-containing domain, PGG domain, ankyrin repeat-containing domain superfamily [Helianthus annuus]
MFRTENLKRYTGSTSKHSYAKTSTINEEEEEEEEKYAKTSTIKEEEEEEEEGETNSVKIMVDEDNDKKKLHKFTIKGNWFEVESILEKDNGLATEAVSSDGSTLLHIAVGIGHNDFVKKLFKYVNEEQVLIKRNSDGSTPLHIAAIVGNKHGAELLVKKNPKLLQIVDQLGDDPLDKAYENMHLDTIGYLLKAMISLDGKTEFLSSLADSLQPGDEAVVVELLVNAISAKHYGLASEVLENFPKSASKSDEVLMTIANSFPCGLDYWETLVYPSLDNLWKLLGNTAILALLLFGYPVILLWDITLDGNKSDIRGYHYGLRFPLFAPVKHIVDKKKQWDEAKKVLELVCDEIDKLDYNDHLKQDKNGYDIIQLAIIKRSEKIYNLIYDIGERKNLYRTYKDSSGNNILHLAGRLAPSSVLNERTGAALQLQRELQWREEVKKFVFPTYITQENIHSQTPDMVFRKEHENLVKEGERWMKTTAESCSITAALITTIVFAAAITVPGGNDGKDGTPLFRKNAAFIIFAISDAISLFASSTALLVFLSILTARFAENDFLVSLPRRLFIGLFSLLLSTTAMMVAFSATLFLVFCDQKLWMLGPICGLAFIPIAFFVGLQFPLMVDLFRSTYIRIFGKQRKRILRRFNPDEIRLRFGM